MFREFVTSTMRLHGDGLLATFWLYGDEGGIHDGSSWCLVCGYVGREDHWIAFDQGWRKVLTDAGLTEFHAKRFFARDNEGKRVPPYQDWDDRRANEFIHALISVLVAAESHLHRIGRGVDTKAFLSLTAGERRYLTGGYFLRGRFRRNTGAPTKPYYLAFFDTYIDALAGLPQDDSVIHFMFDRQNVLQEQAVKAIDVAHDMVKTIAPEWWSRRVGTLSFGEREKYSALQAADLATHLWYSEAESQTTGVPLDKQRALALKAITQRDKKLYVYTREEMERELDKLPEHVRETLKAEA